MKIVAEAKNQINNKCGYERAKGKSSREANFRVIEENGKVGLKNLN